MSAPQTGPVNVYDALQRVTGPIGLGPGAREAAAAEMRRVLADCWDYCAATVLTAERQANRVFPPDHPGKPTGNWGPLNPYAPDQPDTGDALLATQHHDAVEELATMGDEGPHQDGVWIVWRSQGVRNDGFSAIYPQNAEIDALRHVNNDGYGHAEFIPYGPV